jgi:hypothetical protein
MVPPTQNVEGMPPTTKIPVFERVAFFYARRRLRKNKDVWIRKSMLRQLLRGAQQNEEEFVSFQIPILIEEKEREKPKSSYSNKKYFSLQLFFI